MIAKHITNHSFSRLYLVSCDNCNCHVGSWSYKKVSSRVGSRFTIIINIIIKFHQIYMLTLICIIVEYQIFLRILINLICVTPTGAVPQSQIIASVETKHHGPVPLHDSGHVRPWVLSRRLWSGWQDYRPSCECLVWMPSIVRSFLIFKNLLWDSRI